MQKQKQHGYTIAWHNQNAVPWDMHRSSCRKKHLRLVRVQCNSLYGLRGLQGGGGLLCQLLQLGGRLLSVMKLLQDWDHMALCCEDVVLALHKVKMIYFTK